MNEALGAEKFKLASLQRRMFRNIAGGYENAGNVLCFEPDLEPVLVRELADAIAEHCGGIAAVFSGTDAGGYNCCLVTRQGDLRPLGKAMNAALKGRGGGKPNFAQGRVSAARTAIEVFFEKT